MLRTSATPALRSLARNTGRFPLAGLRYTATIPGPSGPEEWVSHGNPLARNMDVCSSMQRKFGDVVRLPANCLGMEVVYVHHPNDIKAVFQKEGKYPSAIGDSFFPWKFWDDARSKRDNESNMLAFSAGEEWKELRTKLQKPIFNPKDAAKLMPSVAALSSGAMQAFPGHVAQHGAHVALTNYTLDVITSLVTGTPLGFSSPNPPHPDSKFGNYMDLFSNFTTSVTKILQDPAATAAFHADPGKTPDYKIFEAAADEFFGKTMDLVRDTLTTLKTGSGPEFERAVGSYIGRIAADGAISDDKFASTAMNFIFAGIDTTATSLAWSMYHLATNPKEQEKLRQSVYTAVGGERGRVTSPLSEEAFPGLSSVFVQMTKESMRLTPSVAGTARCLLEDVKVGREQHLIPAGTLIQLMPLNYTTDPRVWGEDVSQFRPGRWAEIREEGLKEQEDPHAATPALRGHPHMQLNFGKGPRMCIGKRLVDIEVTCFMTELLQRFEVSLPSDHTVPEGDTTNFISTPSPEPLYTFTPIA